MSATKRFITSGLILLGAVALWHGGATIGYAPINGAGEAAPPTKATATTHLASLSLDRDAEQIQQQNRKSQGSAANRGLIDENLRRQFRSERGGERLPQPSRLTPELTETVLEVADQLDPELAVELRYTCEDDSREFERVMYTSGRRLLSLAELKHNEPDLFEFKLDEFRTEARVAQMTEKLREAYHDGDEQRLQELQGELRVLLTEHVAFSLGNQALYMKRLEERFEEHIAELDRQIDETALNFGRLVQEQFKAIMNAARTGNHHEARRNPLETLNN